MMMMMLMMMIHVTCICVMAALGYAVIAAVVPRWSHRLTACV